MTTAAQFVADQIASMDAETVDQLNTYAVRYTEYNGYAEDLGTVVAETAADAIAIVAKTIIATEHRVNTVGDCWEWSGTSYVGGSDVDEPDGFAFYEFSGWAEGDDCLYLWTVSKV